VTNTPESPGPIDTITASPNALTDASASGASPLATMRLLDPGRAPRRKLRYAWRRDRKEELSMDLRTSASKELGGAKEPDIPLPPVHIAIAIDSEDVTPEGDLEYGWQVTSATVTVAPDVSAAFADGMRTEVATIEDLSGTARVTARGLTTRIAISPESVVDAGGTGQMVEQVRQTLRDIAAPLPEEAVGRGARWEKLSQLTAKDARVTQTETFTLVDLTGDRGVVDDVLAQTAPPQPLAAPGQPPGTQARMESMLVSGGAKMHFDLSRLVPQTTFDGTTTMVVSGQSPGERARQMTLVMRVGILLTGTVR
jgi:hypothetical protein